MENHNSKITNQKFEVPKLKKTTLVKAKNVHNRGLKGAKGMLLAIGMMGFGLAVGFVFLGRFLPKPSSVPSRNPIASGSVKPTKKPIAEPTKVEIQLLTVEELEVDRDGDALPDKLEEILGYDADSNDCVRKLGCGDFPTVPRAKLEINLLFLLDASGSMKDKLEGVTRWESAKLALLDLLDSGLPKFANVGLIVYGHKGSSSLDDQKVSCDGVEILEPLSRVDVKGTEKLVNQITPTGWTGISKALDVAGEMLEGKDYAQNFVVLLSDGKETCGGDPVLAAKRLHDSGIEVVTNVVGLTVNDQEREQLSLIAQAGGGRYFGANSREELGDAMVLAAEAVRLWDEVNQCILDNLSGYGECVNVQYMRSLNYLDRLRLYLGEKSGSAAGAGFLDKEYEQIYQRIWKKFNELREENWGQYDADLKKLYPNE